MAELGVVKRKIAELESRGDTAGAIIELEAAIREFENDGSLYNKLGDLYMKVGRTTQALDVYQKGAFAFKEETFYPNAIALCKKILRIDKERTEVYGLLGELHKELGQLVEAANYLLEFAERKMRANHLEDALRTYNTIKELVPNNARILQTISAIYAKLGRNEQGAKLLKEAQQIETKQKEIKETIKEVKIEDMLSPEIASLLNDEGACSAEAIPEAPTGTAVEAEEIAAELAGELEGAADQKTTAEPAAKLEPAKGEELSEVDKTIELGNLYLNLGSEEEAVDCYRDAAQDLFDEDELERCAELNRKIAELRPLDLKSRQQLVDIATRQGGTAAQVEAMFELAEALNRREARTEAQSLFRKILEIDPQHIRAREMISEMPPTQEFIDLGEVLRSEMSEPQSQGVQTINELISQFRKEVFESIGEGDYRSHYDLGVAYKGMGLHQEAIEEFQIAAKDPNLKLKSCEMIGTCLLEKGKPQEAINVLGSGLQVPNRPAGEYFGIQFLIGNCYEAQGKLTEALKSYMNAYSIDKTVPDLARKITALKERLTEELRKKGKAVPQRQPEPKPAGTGSPKPKEVPAAKKSKVTYL